MSASRAPCAGSCLSPPIAHIAGKRERGRPAACSGPSPHRRAPWNACFSRGTRPVGWLHASKPLGLNSFQQHGRLQCFPQRRLTVRANVAAIPADQGPWPVVWTIAGSDSGGGAGIQADLHTCRSFGTHACTAVTAITSQSTTGVTHVQYATADSLRTTIQALWEDMPPAAVKTGMIGSLETLDVAADFLRTYEGPVVCDPVMVASSGARLMAPGLLEAFKTRLLPAVTLLTPNRTEAEALLGRSLASARDVERAARDLVAAGASSCLIKGGDDVDEAGGEPEFAQDCWSDGEQVLWLTSHRVRCGRQHKTVHGTGCTLSSAIAACLAKGLSPLEAIVAAKTYVGEGIARAVGGGVNQPPPQRGSTPPHDNSLRNGGAEPRLASVKGPQPIAPTTWPPVHRPSRKSKPHATPQGTPNSRESASANVDDVARPGQLDTSSISGDATTFPWITQIAAAGRWGHPGGALEFIRIQPGEGLGFYVILCRAESYLRELLAAGLTTVQLRMKPSDVPGLSSLPTPEERSRAYLAAVEAEASKFLQIIDEFSSSSSPTTPSSSPGTKAPPFTANTQPSPGANIPASPPNPSPRHVKFILNDHWQIALRLKQTPSGAAHLWGVHLGQEDLVTADLSSLASAGLGLGVSTHNLAELAIALGVRPSYVALGIVYPTTSKDMPTGPVGTPAVAAWRALVPESVPLVGIGGINLERAPNVLAAGADSVAVITAITHAPDPVKACRDWLALFN
eukprot:jgi/Mesvir1/22390/Mv17881-RA.1